MKIKPFCGLLPDKNLVKDIVSPPYDVISREEAKKIIEKNSFSFLRITRSDAEFDGVSEYSDIVYKKAKENLNYFIEKKLLTKDKESFYLLAQTVDGKTQNGFYALFNCEDYEKGLIKRHELTRKDKEEDRTRHIMEVGADTGPVFLFFKSKEGYDEIVFDIKRNLPDYSFIDEKGVLNELWKVKNVDKIVNFFKDIPHFYIADGHHRAASAVNVWRRMNKPEDSPYSYFFGVVFPSNELSIYPYNRVVKDLNGLSKEIFFDKVKDNFSIERKEIESLSKGEIGMYIDGETFVLKFKHNEKLNTPIEKLDVSILQNYLLSPILGIDDPRTSERIFFVGGKNAISTQKNLVDKGNGVVAFFLHPVLITELMEISDRNEIMPPKSTWFEPKLKDGLVTYMFDIER